MSDIHFSQYVTNEKLQYIANEIKAEKPDYIIISGDLVDSLSRIDSESEQKRFTSWIEQISCSAPVILGLGNHDFYRDPPANHSGWVISQPTALKEALANNKNIHLLDNDFYEDSRIFIYGFTMSPDCYAYDTDKGSKTSYLHPKSENKAAVLKCFQDIQLPKLPTSKPKLMIAHSPVYMDDEDIQPFVKDFDLILSGHMHNGVVPPIINDFWRSNRGLVAPGKSTFPVNARNTLHKASDKVIVTGAITTMQDGFKEVLNKFFPIYIGRLELTNNDIYKRKPNVHNKYINCK